MAGWLADWLQGGSAIPAPPAADLSHTSVEGVGNNHFPDWLWQHSPGGWFAAGALVERMLGRFCLQYCRKKPDPRRRRWYPIPYSAGSYTPRTDCPKISIQSRERSRSVVFVASTNPFVSAEIIERGRKEEVGVPCATIAA